MKINTGDIVRNIEVTVKIIDVYFHVLLRIVKDEKISKHEIWIFAILTVYRKEGPRKKKDGKIAKGGMDISITIGHDFYVKKP